MVQVIALIYAGSYGLAGIRDYQQQVMPILRQHQGILISASTASVHGDGPDEIHIIRFPSMAEFLLYKADPRHQRLIELRTQCINRVELHITDRFYDY